MKSETDAGEQVRVTELLRVLEAAKRGDFNVRMPVRGSKANREVAEALNEIFELNQHTATEFEGLAAAVAREGRIGHRAEVAGRGAWAEKVRNVNAVVDALAQQTTELSRVFGAVAKGDLSQTVALGVDGRKLKGQFLHTAQLVNGMVEQLNSFASEVTRVAREVGTEGKLGGQANVRGVGGIWKDLTDNVNSMATNLTTQVRNIAEVTTAVAKGDLSKKITVDVRGEILELKDTINTMVDQLSSFASEVTRVAREVGTEGKLGGQAEVPGVGGIWKDLTDNVNWMASNLTTQVRNIAEVTTAVARGDLSRHISVDVRGEILELKNTINTMVDQLGSFASEVTRVAREVGTEGKLGGQAVVRGVAGTWKDLTDNVNSMASNLTTQVRGIAKVVTARRQRRPQAQAGARREGRDRRAGRHHQRHDRHARRLRRPGHHRGARGRHRGQAGRAGPRARHGRHLARPHRQRQPAGRQPHHPGARDRRGGHRRRPPATSPGRSPSTHWARSPR